MEIQIRQAKLVLRVGDITKQEVDVIVNAANNNLVHGGGVAAAIASAAGPKLIEASKRAGYVKTGSYAKTNAGNLQAKYVFHAVGPVWNGGIREENKYLASAVRSCLEGMEKERLQTIAFPAISTGIYGYPIDKAAQIILKTIVQFLKNQASSIKVVKVILFTDKDLLIFRKALNQMEI